jgi:hypothetical protein
VVRDGDTALAPGRLVLRAQNEELVRPGLSPCLLPLGVRWKSVFFQMKLGVEQLPRAEAQAHMAGFSLCFQLLKTAFQTGQAPPLLVKLLRARLAFPEPGDDLLGFPDPGRQVGDLQGKQSTPALDLTLELDAHRVELTRRDRKADQILGFEPVGSFALFEIPVESALDPAEQHGILQQHLVLFGRYRCASPRDSILLPDGTHGFLGLMAGGAATVEAGPERSQDFDHVPDQVVL